jgi:PEP-CTERM motif
MWLPSRRCRNFAFATLLTMPLWADVASVTGSLSTGTSWDTYGYELGVDFYAINGNYEPLDTQMADWGYWGVGFDSDWAINSPSLPAGSIVDSATFTVDIVDPEQVATYPAITNGYVDPVSVTVETSYYDPTVAVTDMNGLYAASSGPTVSFTPSSANFTIYPSVFGGASVYITNVTLPPCPSNPSGSCSAIFSDYVMGPQIDYTLSVNYTPASAVPEPGFFGLAGIGTFGLLVLGRKRRASR